MCLSRNFSTRSVSSGAVKLPRQIYMIPPVFSNGNLTALVKCASRVIKTARSATTNLKTSVSAIPVVDDSAIAVTL